MIDLDAIWESFAGRVGILSARPNFRFDAKFYDAADPTLTANGLDLLTHFERHGMAEGRPGNLYNALRRGLRNLDRLIGVLLLPSDLKQAVVDLLPGAAELALELMLLPGDIDAEISDFSSRYYASRYPDVPAANILPLRHYLEFGRREGRASLGGIRENFHMGEKSHDPSKNTIIFGVHEFSFTGAPLLGLELVREAAETSNVIVISLRDGPLLERFRKECMSIFISQTAHEEIDFVLGDMLPKVEYAVLHSAETAPFIKMLVGRSIPFATYIHECPQYCLPHFKTIYPSLYADCLIYSSENVRDAWRDIHEDLGFDTDQSSAIIPQAELLPGTVTPSRYKSARERISKLIGRDIGDRKLIYGCGSAHWRKGTDLFVIIARMMQKRDPDSIFIWIGDGVNHEDVHSGVYLEKHMVEAQVNVPGAYLHFLPTGSYYKDLCAAADVFVLTSRMDPLPTVVLEAVAYDNETVLFEHASGFDDATYDSMPRLHKIGYAMLDEAVEVIARLDRKEGRTRKRDGQDVLPAPAVAPNLFKRVSAALESQLTKRRHFYLGGGQYDLPFLFSSSASDKPYREIERRKAWSNNRLAVWKSDQEAARALAVSTHPVHQNSRVARYQDRPLVDLPDFSIHVHAYYTDDLEHDLSSYLTYRHANKIVITTDTERKSNSINRILKGLDIKAEILTVVNQGRDILPFMKLFYEIEKYGDDDIWGHVHQKKSLTSSVGGDIWRSFMLRILFGDSENISSALTGMADSKIGLAAPFDPYICGWYASKRIMPMYQRLVPTQFADHPILFSVGNMFWTRRAVVDRMNSYFGKESPWPNEPIANDGTVFHLIERLWPTAAYEAGLESVFVSKPDQPRR